MTAASRGRTGADRIAAEQAALRRVATPVGRGTPPEEVFAAEAGQYGRLLAVEFAVLVRHDHAQHARDRNRRHLDHHWRACADPGRQPAAGLP